MQKRIMIDINNVKKVAQAMDYLIEVVRETFNSVTNNNSSGSNTIGKISSTVTTTEVVTKGSGSTLLGTSPDVYSWDPIRVLNPEWLATHTPFSIE